MEPIRIPVTLSPHIVKSVPRGYYVLAQRLFPNGAPILNKSQFVGYNGQLIISVDRENRWDSLLKMAIYANMVGGEPTTWLDTSNLWPMSMGFRTYIPGTVLKPTETSKKVEMTGVFRCHDYYGGAASLYYLQLPIGPNILLRRETL